jgi:UDP-N-acetylglucosamine diphosphorylase/glucosamine-1-phosphate N-acetyltransferase
MHLKPASVLLFEPENYQALYPFSELHPVWELRCGALRLFEKIQQQFPSAELVFHADDARTMHLRSFLMRFFPEYAATLTANTFAIKPTKTSVEEPVHASAERASTPSVATAASAAVSDVLVLQGNVLPTQALWQTLARDVEQLRDEHPSKPLVFVHRGHPFAAWIPQAVFLESDFMPDTHQLSQLRGALYDAAHEVSVDAHIVTHLWDALRWNGEAIADDERFFKANAWETHGTHGAYTPASEIPQGFQGTSDAVFQGVFMTNPERIYCAEGVRIDPLTVLDASKGAIILGTGAHVMAQSTIVGPCAIGEFSTVKIGTRLYENTSLGEHCKVGGELKNTIIQAFSNKQHDGCLGYSFLGEWVNLGAGTNVSDLKNNYSRIRVQLPREASADAVRTPVETETGQTSLGMLCGCHAKSGINSMFNTGTVIGVGANIFDGNYPAKYIPAFSWGGRKDSPAFELDKALELARTVMARRKRSLTAPETALLRASHTRAWG